MGWRGISKWATASTGRFRSRHWSFGEAQPTAYVLIFPLRNTNGCTNKCKLLLARGNPLLPQYPAGYVFPTLPSNKWVSAGGDTLGQRDELYPQYLGPTHSGTGMKASVLSSPLVC